MVVCLLLFCHLILRYLFCRTLARFYLNFIPFSKFVFMEGIVLFLEIIRAYKLFVIRPITLRITGKVNVILWVLPKFIAC